jgi:hypothetical protein
MFHLFPGKISGELQLEKKYLLFCGDRHFSLLSLSGGAENRDADPDAEILIPFEES